MRIAVRNRGMRLHADCPRAKVVAAGEVCIERMELKTSCSLHRHRVRRTAIAAGRSREIYTQGIWLIFWTIGLLLWSLTGAVAESLSCEVILRDAYDRSRGLTIWDEFPKIGVLAADPQRQFFIDRGVPLVQKIWRFMNDVGADRPIQITPYFAMRVQSIASVDDLWGDKVLYVSLSKVIGSLPIQPEKVDAASRRILQSRIGDGSPIITSFNFDVKEANKVHRIAFVSPVIPNIPPTGLNDVDLATTILEVLTNFRIEELSSLRNEVSREYAAGCLEIFSKGCAMFDIARNMYRHRSDLKKDLKIDVASKICDYVRLE